MIWAVCAKPYCMGAWNQLPTIRTVKILICVCTNSETAIFSMAAV